MFSSRCYLASIILFSLQCNFVISFSSLYKCAYTSKTQLGVDNRREFISAVASGSFFGVSNTIFSSRVSAAELLESVNSDDVSSQQPTSDSEKLAEALYSIIRVREATQQETRLIKSGKFKDVQRANVKLAVKFMIQNYRFNDNLIVAASFLENPKRVQASEVGQSAVQDLYTILEYFDASDIQNLKVGTYDSMAGKEPLVLNGLEATKIQVDKFLSFFPKTDVDAAKQRVVDENMLNEKEYDVANLGSIGNLSAEDILK
mmetsp:Transcript_12715/g.16601  ORF Transcript_12715/g.16601 Transcript_12715/m.16601 type:complete len:260 (+) Transcript_12715:251-1030(+)